MSHIPFKISQMSEQRKKPITYRDAGVDIERGASLVEQIKPAVKRTHRTGVASDIGGFGGLFALGDCGFNDPILVSATDGVGTKLKLAIETQRHTTVGIDLVAMCVNDIIVQGAEPLFFLDYFASGRLDVGAAREIIEGIARGCEIAGAALLGGETAEMPDMYRDDDYDLAGFCVGAVERDRVLENSRVQIGDQILGIASSGLHSNGYSLVRRILADQNVPLTTKINGSVLADVLLEPTRIYVKPLLEVLREFDLHGLAHITGGGITENLSDLRLAGRYGSRRTPRTPAHLQLRHRHGRHCACGANRGHLRGLERARRIRLRHRRGRSTKQRQRRPLPRQPVLIHPRRERSIIYPRFTSAPLIVPQSTANRGEKSAQDLGFALPQT